ncbi:MAG TPA: zf-HC2 domain-containing protein [Candidatus Acidoferrales bacterium]|nr:zf-HC2 domain-containing protein [Candidatus Acidoferrales bacterium]
MIHFDEMACLLYLERQLDPARSREISAHLQECASCRDLLHALERETTLLSSALTEDNEPMPARLVSREGRGLPPWAWTLAFAAFAAGAYWFWTDGIGPWFDQLSSAGFGGTDVFSMIVFSGAFWEGWSDMIDAMQIGALILLAIVAIGWIRRRLRRTVAIAVVVSALLLALALPQESAAAEVRRGRPVLVPAGDVVHNDLIAAGPSVRIDGTVEGDLIAFTRSLTVTGHVTGDIIAFAGEVVIDGNVDGNVRVFARSAILQGIVGKNVTAFGNSVDLISKANVGGGMIVFAAESDLDGKVQRDLLGMVGRTDLDGLIGGQLWIRGGTLTVASTAEIRGPATFEGPQQPVVEAGAKLASPIRTEITQAARRNRMTAARVTIRAIFSYATALVVGILLLVIFPGFYRAALREAGAIGLPIGIGALALIAGAFLLVLGVLLIIVGSGAGVAAAMAYAPILYVAQVFVGAWLGNKIMGETSVATSALVGRMAVGLLILHVVGFIPVLGVLVRLTVLLWGTGAVLLGFYTVSRVESAPVPA